MGYFWTSMSDKNYAWPIEGSKTYQEQDNSGSLPRGEILGHCHRLTKMFIDYKGS